MPADAHISSLGYLWSFYIVLSTFEQIKPASAKTGQIIYKQYGGHFVLYQKTTYEIKTKDHCESKKPAYNY